MENKQTAVEFMYNEMLLHLNFDQRLYLREIYQQAKEMEKSQTERDFINGYKNADVPLNHKLLDKYYNETYKYDSTQQ